MGDTASHHLLERRKHRKSYILRILSAFALSTMFILIKLGGERGAHLFEMMFFRQIVTVPAIYLYLKATQQLALLKTQRLGAHGVRSFMGMGGMILNFSAVILLSPAEYTTIGFMTPIFAVIIGIIFYGEKRLPIKYFAAFLGFMGVLIITNPSASHASLFGVAVGLAGALLTAFINFQLQNLTRTEASITIVFYFAAFSIIFFLPLVLFNLKPHGWDVYALLLGIGIVGTIAQLLMTSALRFGSVSSILILDYTAIIWAVVYGWLFWDTIPALTFWIGAPLVVLAGLLITRRR